MRKIKIISIWLAAMFVIILISDITGAFLINKFEADDLKNSVLGFSSKADGMINPKKNSEEEIDKRNGLEGISIRSALGDDRIENETDFRYNFLFANIIIDESFILFDQNGLNELSSGIFAVVYQSYGNTMDYLKHAQGVIDVRDFIKSEKSSEIYSVLDKNPEAVMRLNSYTICNYIIKPVSVTILDENGTELLNVEFPYEGEPIKASECYIYNDWLSHKMDVAQLGERKTDKIAHGLVKEVSFNKGDYMDDKIKYGIANITVQHIEVTNGYAMISVQRHQYIKGVLFYTIILGSIMTIIMFVVIRKRIRRLSYL